MAGFRVFVAAGLCAMTAALLHARPSPAGPAVLTGADVLLDSADAAPLSGKRVGFITNRAAVDARGIPVVDLFASDSRFTLAAIFTPEHGLKADRQGKIGDEADPATRVVVHSLYGKTLKPTPEMLKGLDALVFDIPDVGARFYTFISTMRLAMEAAREAGIPFVVLDRPNPIGGELLEGGVLEPAFRSFTGPFEIPVRHGMTVGELAGLFNTQIGADLHVVRMKGWQRAMWFDQTGLPWTRPSPAMVSLTTATLYPGICFFEATQIDCRVGEKPFERIAAPWLDARRIAADLAARRLPGVEITAERVDGSAPNPYSFRPASWWAGFLMDPAAGSSGLLVGSGDAGPVARIGGAPGDGSSGQPDARSPFRAIAFRVTDRSAFRPVRTALETLALALKYHPDQVKVDPRGFDRLAGTDKVRIRLLAGDPVEAVLGDWQASLAGFERERKRFLLYR